MKYILRNEGQKDTRIVTAERLRGAVDKDLLETEKVHQGEYDDLGTKGEFVIHKNGKHSRTLIVIKA
jgi:hypothetical protein